MFVYTVLDEDFPYIWQAALSRLKKNISSVSFRKGAKPTFLNV